MVGVNEQLCSESKPPRRGSRILKLGAGGGGGVNFWNNVGLHAGQCVCGLKMNKLIGRTSHRLCTFSTSVREIKYYFNI